MRILYPELHHHLYQSRLHPHNVIVKFKIYCIWFYACLIKSIYRRITVHDTIRLPHKVHFWELLCNPTEKTDVCTIMSIDPDVIPVHDIRCQDIRNKILHIAATAGGSIDNYSIILIHNTGLFFKQIHNLVQIAPCKKIFDISTKTKIRDKDCRATMEIINHQPVK